jgi:hypothetical protein
VIVYLAADRSTVFLQIWSGISAWYPPTGIALALLLGLGVRYAPLYVLAGLLAGRVNYHQAFFTYTFADFRHVRARREVTAGRLQDRLAPDVDTRRNGAGICGASGIGHRRRIWER